MSLVTKKKPSLIVSCCILLALSWILGFGFTVGAEYAAYLLA